VSSELLAQKILYWRDNPDRFVIEVIGAEPDPWQVHALRALYEKNRVSIAAKLVEEREKANKTILGPIE